MNHVHVSARCPTTLVAEISLMARRAGRSFSAEVRLALAEHVARGVHQTDDDPPGRAGRVEDSPAGASRAAA